MTPEPSPAFDGTLVQNLMHFARALRAAGLPIGPGQVLAAVQAVEAAGVTSRSDFYWTLHAVLVNRREQREIFDQAFKLFWRNPRILEQMMSLLLAPTPPGDADQQQRQKVARRLADALQQGLERQPPEPNQEKVEVRDAALTWSAREVLQRKDFEQMSAEELAEAKAQLARLVLPLAEVPTRRLAPFPYGHRIDPRASLRQALKTGGELLPLRFARRRSIPPPLVVMCDISGSMGRYSRLLLHFLHALSNARTRVHAFLFGTRLTNITRHLRYRDVDLALDRVSAAVPDWAGGTRIGATLHEFNQRWGRRVLGQGAVVLLIIDGLDRDAGEGLGEEVARLAKSCRRLIWLNPLLRYARFEPKSLGMRAILPHVDDFRPAHNLDSLAALAQALSATPPPRRRAA